MHTGLNDWEEHGPITMLLRIGYGVKTRAAIRTCVSLVLLASLQSAAFAGHRSSSSDSDLGPLFSVVAVVVFVLVMLFINASRKPQQVTEDEWNVLIREAENWYHSAVSGELPPVDTSVILRSGEIPILNEASTLAEARAVRVYAGGGTRIQGIYIGGGESTSFDELKNIDSGTLTITNQRLIFSGQLQQRVLANTDIVSARPYGGDAFSVSSQTRAKTQVYSVRNPVLWSYAIQMVVRGDIHVTRTPTAPDDLPPQSKASPPPLQQKATSAQKTYLSDLGVQYDSETLTKADAAQLIGRTLADNKPTESQLNKLQQLGFLLKSKEKYTLTEIDQLLILANRKPFPHDVEKLRDLKIDLTNGSALDCRILLELDEEFQAASEFAHLGAAGIAKACAAAARDSALYNVTLAHDQKHKQLVFEWPLTKLREWAAKAV